MVSLSLGLVLSVTLDGARLKTGYTENKCIVLADRWEDLRWMGCMTEERSGGSTSVGRLNGQQLVLPSFYSSC